MDTVKEEKIKQLKLEMEEAHTAVMAKFAEVSEILTNLQTSK